MVFDATIAVVLGHHEPCLYKMVNLINARVLTAPLMGRFPIAPPLLGPPFPETAVLQLGQLKNPIRAYECSSKRKSLKPLTLNQKLETIELSEEDMSKAKTG